MMHGETYKPVNSTYSKTVNNQIILLTTGADDRFKAKNIFDLAGNVSEWTMEANSSTNRVNRGGSCELDGTTNPATMRSSKEPNFSYCGVGFRPALYL